jgi:mannose-6-phosphate isomerase-like protein (cupin superfamily)
MHLHTREDEYSFILEGRWGFQLADTVVYGEPGDLVFKPRHVWHSFWNATDEPARLLEIISPAGFEQFFAQVSAAGALRTAGRRRVSLIARHVRASG